MDLPGFDLTWGIGVGGFQVPELMGSTVYYSLGRKGFGFLSHCMPRGKRNIMLYMARERHFNTFVKNMLFSKTRFFLNFLK